LYVVSAVET